MAALDRAELLRLKEDLASPDPDVRRAATARVAELADATLAAVLSEALASDNPAVRERALGLLDALDETQRA